jgi:putative ABC transport system permease protein
MVKAEVRGIQEMTSTLPIAIFLINCALLAAILWRMIRLEFPFIGTLRALGLSRLEILRHYLILPLTVAIVGILVGIPGGLALTRPFLVYYANFFNLPVDRIAVEPVLIASSILAPIILFLTTASIVIFKALRLTPLSLIRGYKRKPKAMLLEKQIRFHKARFESKFRIRQMVRSSGKLFVAMLGVAFATVLLLLGFLVQDSYNTLLEKGIRQTFRYSYNYVFKTLQTGNPYGGEPYQMLAAKESSQDESVVIQGLSKNEQMLRLVDQQDNPIDLASVAVSRVLSDKLQLAVGDTITFRNSLDGKTYALTIGAIAEVYIMNSIYLPMEDFNRLFNLPTGSYIGIYSESALLIPTQNLYMAERMSEVLASYETYAGMLKMVILGLGLLSSLMALVILYILISLMIEENRRSIALLKILGYEAREIRRLILRTLDIPVIIGFITGIPLIFVLYGRIINSSFQEIDMTIPLRLSPWYMAAAFSLLYLTYVITRHISCQKIFRISMSDELKNMQE